LQPHGSTWHSGCNHENAGANVVFDPEAELAIAMVAWLFSLHILGPILGIALVQAGAAMDMVPVDVQILAVSSLIIYASAHIPLAESAVLEAEEVSTDAK